MSGVVFLKNITCQYREVLLEKSFRDWTGATSGANCRGIHTCRMGAGECRWLSCNLCSNINFGVIGVPAKSASMH